MVTPMKHDQVEATSPVAMGWPRAGWILTALCVGAMLAAPAYNLLVDNPGVFSAPGERTGPLLNERHVKLELLLEHDRPFDTLLFGTSKTAMLPLPGADIPGYGAAYNFGIRDARPAELVAMLEFMVERGHAPQRVVIGLDPVLFKDDDPQTSALHHPDLRDVPLYRWVSENAFKSPPFGLFTVIAEILAGEQLPVTVWDLSLGHYTQPRREAQIATNPDGVLGLVKAYDPNGPDLRISLEHLDDLRRLRAYAVSQGIDLCFHWHPLNRWERARYPADHIEAILGAIERDFPEMIEIGPYPWLDDAAEWLDQLHPRRARSEQVMDDVLAGCAAMFGVDAPLSLHRPLRDQTSNDS